MALRHFFVCDNCRAACHDMDDCGPGVCPTVHAPRKQAVKCLGPYCDVPCGLQDETGDLTKDQLIKLVLFLSDTVDSLMIKEGPQNGA